MNYILKYNESKLGNRFGKIKNYLFPFNKGLPNIKKSWKIYKNKFNIELCIQPGFKTNEYLENRIDDFLEHIYNLSRKYILINNSAELYQLGYSTNIKFRLTDSDDLTSIPVDIIEKISEDVKNEFSIPIEAEYFDNRNPPYIFFNINLYIDPDYYDIV